MGRSVFSLGAVAAAAACTGTCSAFAFRPAALRARPGAHSANSSGAASPSGLVPGFAAALAAAALGVAAAAAALGASSAAGARRLHGRRTASAVYKGRATEVRTKPAFDPLGLCADLQTFQDARSVESVLGRTAMLATLGLPVAEMTHERLAEAVDLPSRLADGGRGPMALNGGDFGPLAEIAVAAGIASVLLTAAELRRRKEEDAAENLLNPRNLSTPTLSPMLQAALGVAELINGRVAMTAFPAIVAQEHIMNQPVVETAPAFFGLP